MKKPVKMKTKNLIITASQAAKDEAVWDIVWEVFDKSGTLLFQVRFAGKPNEQHEVTFEPDAAVWKSGYATEAVKQICEWAFSTENCYYIQVKAAPEIPEQAAVLTECGFKPPETEDADTYELEKPASAFTAIYMCLGLSVGLCLGQSFDNLATGMCIGIAIGAALGAVMDNADRKKRMNKKIDSKK